MKIIDNTLVEVSSSDISADGKFVVPNNITTIGDSAFQEHDSLTKVIIPDGVTKIEKLAFHGCKSLTEVIIPDSVTEIGDFAFAECRSLEEIVIPEGVTEIRDYTFENCSLLKKTVLSDNVTEIGHSSFENCSSLTKIVIPDGVTEIGDYAFWKCSSLEEIVIPDSVTEIGGCAFVSCSSLKEIIIPDNVTTIRNNTFRNCQTLSKITWKNKTYPVCCIDGYCMCILKEKQWEDCNILKCTYFPNEDIVYVAQKAGFSAHGDTIRDAVNDLQYKLMDQTNVSKHIARIAQQGYMTANGYRLLTGACRQGTDYFLRKHNLTWEDTMPVEEVLKLTKGFYGHEKFQEVANKILTFED